MLAQMNTILYIYRMFAVYSLHSPSSGDKFRKIDSHTCLFDPADRKDFGWPFIEIYIYKRVR